MIEMDRVTKWFGRAKAADGVSLQIAPGESVALWGVNGAGKTTIIRCVLGLYRYRGTIRVAGLDVRRHGKAARHAIGYVPQELGFYDELRVGAAVRFFGRLRGLNVTDVDGVLGRVGLEGHHAKRIRELSGGMKQRLALAIALLGDPRVLVLDEVTASLDAVGRSALISLLGTLTRSADHTTLFASHRVEEIAAMATRVVVLERGRVTNDLPVDEFLRRWAPRQVLHVFLEPRQSGQAIEHLRQRGFNARMNGQGILIPVVPGRRAEPLQMLHEARVRVDDFEVLEEPPPGGDAWAH